MGKDIKKILIPNQVPPATSFKVDQIVINPIDGKAFIKKTDNTVIELGSGSGAVVSGTTNTGSLLTTASATNNILTFTQGDGSTFNVTIDTGSGGTIDTSSLLNNAVAQTTNTLRFTRGNASTLDVVHTASLSQAITASLNSDVGAVSNNDKFAAGSSIEDLLRAILVDFIAPTLTSFVITNLASEMEAGDSEVVTAGTYGTGSDSNGAGFPGTNGLRLSLSGNSSGNGTISSFVTTSATVIDFDDTTVNKNTAGNVTFTLTGTNTQGGTATRTDSNSFRSPIFFGGSAVEAISGSVSTANLASILADITSSTPTSAGSTGLRAFNSETGTFGTQTYLNTTSTTNFPSTVKIQLPASSANTNNFTYIAYPSSYGELQTILRNDVTDESGTVTLVGTVNHTRYTTIEYFLYKSAGKNFGADVLTIDDA